MLLAKFWCIVCDSFCVLLFLRILLSSLALRLWLFCPLLWLPLVIPKMSPLVLRKVLIFDAWKIYEDLNPWFLFFKRWVNFGLFNFFYFSTFCAFFYIIYFLQLYPGFQACNFNFLIVRVMPIMINNVHHYLHSNINMFFLKVCGGSIMSQLHIMPFSMVSLVSSLV